MSPLLERSPVLICPALVEYEVPVVLYLPPRSQNAEMRIPPNRPILSKGGPPEQRDQTQHTCSHSAPSYPSPVAAPTPRLAA
jgi:hypothetical protein